MASTGDLRYVCLFVKGMNGHRHHRDGCIRIRREGDSGAAYALPLTHYMCAAAEGIADHSWTCSMPKFVNFWAVIPLYRYTMCTNVSGLTNNSGAAVRMLGKA